mmetsp:Transcript_128323/g.369540  ORF Transcript_128323/g.369540 Transcript_128323/m.369540 type:complete len:223 (+) Transcript_128323:361-1029(+)
MPSPLAAPIRRRGSWQWQRHASNLHQGLGGVAGRQRRSEDGEREADNSSDAKESGNAFLWRWSVLWARRRRPIAATCGKLAPRQRLDKRAMACRERCPGEGPLATAPNGLQRPAASLVLREVAGLDGQLSAPPPERGLLQALLRAPRPHAPRLGHEAGACDGLHGPRRRSQAPRSQGLVLPVVPYNSGRVNHLGRRRPTVAFRVQVSAGGVQHPAARQCDTL